MTELQAASVKEAHIMFLYGLQRRKMFATVKNQESSRSHTIFQIKLCLPCEKEMKVISKFSLVDLAGSERLSEGETTQERIDEAKFINKSLSALGNVIAALKHNKRPRRKAFHIPYRDSKLTHILKDSLGGNSMTNIIINISPSILSISENLSSMQFAQNARSVRQQLKENVLLKEIRSLSAKRRQRYYDRPLNHLKFAKEDTYLFSSGDEDDEKYRGLSQEGSREAPQRHQQIYKCLKNLKNELAQTKTKIKSNQTIKQLFMKTHIYLY